MPYTCGSIFQWSKVTEGKITLGLIPFSHFAPIVEPKPEMCEDLIFSRVGSSKKGNALHIWILSCLCNGYNNVTCFCVRRPVIKSCFDRVPRHCNVWSFLREHQKFHAAGPLMCGGKTGIQWWVRCYAADWMDKLTSKVKMPLNGATDMVWVGRHSLVRGPHAVGLPILPGLVCW